PPGPTLLGPVRQPLHGLDPTGIRQGPRIEHFVAETRHERDEHGIVEVSPGFGETKRTRHVDLRRGRHPPEHSPPRAATATATKRHAAAWGHERRDAISSGRRSIDGNKERGHAYLEIAQRRRCGPR